MTVTHFSLLHSRTLDTTNFTLQVSLRFRQIVEQVFVIRWIEEGTFDDPADQSVRTQLIQTLRQLFRLAMKHDRNNLPLQLTSDFQT